MHSVIPLQKQSLNAEKYILVTMKYLTAITDNGHQFVSSEFDWFSREGKFAHTTSSLYHSQPHGQDEAAVKIVDILDWRNACTDGTKSSHVQRPISCRTQAFLYKSKKMSKRPAHINTVYDKKQKYTIKKVLRSSLS